MGTMNSKEHVPIKSIQTFVALNVLLAIVPSRTTAYHVKAASSTPRWIEVAWISSATMGSLVILTKKARGNAVVAIPIVLNVMDPARIVVLHVWREWPYYWDIVPTVSRNSQILSLHQMASVKRYAERGISFLRALSVMMAIGQVMMGVILSARLKNSGSVI